MHFLISSIRQLLRRFKAVAVINVVGLAVAFAVVVVVALQVRYDLSYDRGFKNSKEIFTVETDWGSGGGYSQSVNWNLPHLWKDRIPEIKEFCLVEWGPPEMAFKTEESGDETAVNASATMVTSGFMNVFTPEIVAGDASETFTGPGAQSGQGHCIISETTARAIFGDENPVGRVIVSPQYYVRLTVDAVYRDFPAGSSIASGIIATTQDQGNIGNFSWAGYFMFDPADREAVLTKMNDRQWLVEVGNGRYDNYSFGLTGITDYYLHGGVEGKGGHAGYTTYLAVIGLLILIVAIINFINLSMAMAPSRVRTINIHRILGIGTRQMRFQLSLESAAMALAAVAAGCFIIHWFGGTVFTGFFTADLSLRHNVFPVAIAAAALLVVAFAVGAYSAHYASSFDAAIALKSSFALSRRGAGLRNTLIVVQFVTAVFFICLSTVERNLNSSTVRNCSSCPLSGS